MVNVMKITTLRNFVLAGSILAVSAICNTAIAANTQKNRNSEGLQVAAYAEGLGGVNNSTFKLLPSGTLGIGVEALSEKGFHSDININAGTMLSGEIIAGYLQKLPNDRIKMDYYGTIAGYHNLVNNTTFPANSEMTVTPMFGETIKYTTSTEQTFPYESFNAGVGVKMNSQLDPKGITNLGIGVEGGYHKAGYNVNYRTNLSNITNTYTTEIYDFSTYKHPWYITPTFDFTVKMPKGFYWKFKADLYKLKAGFGWKFWEGTLKKANK